MFIPLKMVLIGFNRYWFIAKSSEADRFAAGKARRVVLHRFGTSPTVPTVTMPWSHGRSMQLPTVAQVDPTAEASKARNTLKVS